MPVPILITRPLPAAEGFAKRLRLRLGDRAEITLSPVIRIEQLHPALGDLADFGAIVITSGQALDALANYTTLPTQTLYCVGASTTAAARALGLNAVEAGPTAKSLVENLIATRPAAPLLYLRGEQISLDLAKTLNSAGIETHQSISYRQVPTKLSADALILLQGSAPVIVPLFSARSAALFFDQCPPNAQLNVIAISDAVRKIVPSAHQSGLVVAPNPTAEDMEDMVLSVTGAA